MINLKMENSAKAQGQPLHVTIHAQYVRDMSFENPGAPQSLKTQGQPDMDINIGMDARKIPDGEKLSGLYEVALNVRATAKNKGETLFIAELQYGILAEIGESVPEETHHPLLLIELPRMAFPFVRQILSDMTQNGGFPPLMLAPVDFTALYMQRFGDEIAKSRNTTEKKS